MTEYKENVWYGWNGGECPVHPRSIVQVRNLKGGSIESHPSHSWAAENENEAGWFNPDCWSGSNTERSNPIVAFRVVKEYREQRELWHLLNSDGEVLDTYDNRLDAEKEMSRWANVTLVHYREVMDGDAQ